MNEANDFFQSLNQPASIRNFLDEMGIVPGPSGHDSGFDFKGTLHYPFDLSKSFQDWLNLFIEIIKKDDILCIYRSDILFPLLRSEDIEQVECKLDIEKYPDGHEFYFLTGYYDRVQKLKSWNDIKDDVENLYPDGKSGPWVEEGTPGKTKIHIKREYKFKLCEQFGEMGILGNSPYMVKLYAEIGKVCAGIKRYPNSLPNILITGEPGVGKESLARAIHQISGRKGEFRAINCAGIPKNLLESELFGHVAGAFTGALGEKRGMLEVCNKGTFQLDEIDKMAPHLQAKLFRALQEREIRRLGSTDPLSIDVLFVATSNEELAPKEDGAILATALYGRLSGIAFEVPPLRDRVADIPLLVNHFLKSYHGNNVDRYRFPVAIWCMGQVDGMTNNVRELENLVRRVVYHFLDSDEIFGESPMMIKLRAAIDRHKTDSGKFPMMQAKLAKRVGVPQATLHDYPKEIQKLVDEGTLKPTKKFPKEG